MSDEPHFSSELSAPSWFTPGKIKTLKSWPEYFKDLKNGSKTFEIRQGDPDEFFVNQVLVIDEFNPETSSETGQSIAFRVTYVMKILDSIDSSRLTLPFPDKGRTVYCLGLKRL